VDFDTTGLTDGTPSTVASFDDPFIFDATSTATADGVTIFAPLVGPGRWFRQFGLVNGTSNRWTQQAAWFIDPAGGNDENTGLTALTALATLAELQRRISGGLISQNTVVTLASGNYGALVLELTIDPTFTFTVQGALTTTATGTFSAVTNSTPLAAPGVSTRGAVTNTGGDPAFTDLSRLRLTNAPNSGAIAWVTRVIAAGNVNVSRWATFTPATGTTPTIINAAIGNTYAVDTLDSVIERVDVVTHGFGRFIVRECYVANPRDDQRVTNEFRGSGSNLTGAQKLLFYSCIFDGTLNGGFGTIWRGSGALFVSCQFLDPQEWFAEAFWEACVFSPRSDLASVALRAGSTIFAGRGNCCEGFMIVTESQLLLYQFGAADFEFSDVPAFGSPAVEVSEAGYILISNATAIMWGADNAPTFGFAVRSLSGIASSPIGGLNIPGGTVGDTSIGGVTTAYAALPSINAANNAAIVAQA